MVNPMGIRNPMGIGVSGTLGAEYVCQWVNLHDDDKCAFRASEAKINNISIGSFFSVFQNTTLLVKGHIVTNKHKQR
jgi:hypothetical protein